MEKKVVLFVTLAVLLGSLTVPSGPASATVSSSSSRMVYICTGDSNPYTFDFGVEEASEIQVIKTLISSGVEAVLRETTDYTVSCTNGDCTSGGTVVLGTACAAGYKLTILRNVPLTQASDFTEGMPTLYETFEKGLDKITNILQQHEENIKRAPKFPAHSAYSNIKFPEPGAGYYLRWNNSGTAIEAASEVTATGSFLASGTGAVSRSVSSKLGETVSVTDYGAVAGDSTDDLDEFVYAHNAAPAGSILLIPPGTYNLSGSWTVSKALTIIGYGATLTFSASNTAGITIASSNVHIYGLTVTGPQYETYQPYERAIYSCGTVGAEYSGIILRDITIQTWGGSGVWLGFITDFSIDDVRVANIGYAGIMIYCSHRGQINNPIIRNITQATGADSSYGVSISKGGGPLATYPRSTQITVNNAQVNGVTSWECLDVHGGDGIRFIGGSAKNCYIGGVIASALNDTDNTSLRSGFIGVEFDSGVTDGTRREGIQIVPAGASTRGTGNFAIANTIINHGLAVNTGAYGAILVQRGDGSIVHDNTIVNPSRAGITVDSSTGVSVQGNTIIDPWNYTANVSYPPLGIEVSTATTAEISGNTIKTLSLSGAAIWVLSYGIQVSNDATNMVYLGPNWITSASILDVRDIPGQVTSSNLGRTSTVQFDKTDTTLANVTGLWFYVLAGKTYSFRAVLYVDADATGGQKVAIGGTATATSIIYRATSTDDGAPGAVRLSARATALGSGFGNAGETGYLTMIEGTIKVANAGRLAVQFAQNAANGTSSVLVGSTFEIMEVIAPSVL